MAVLVAEEVVVIDQASYNNQLVNPPAGMGRFYFSRSSLRFTAQQQKRYVSGN
jgi:hypothetical protein